MLPDLSPIQWAAIAGAAALIVVPRLTALKGVAGSLTGLFRRAESTPDIHAKVDAYRTLAVDLPPELARQVWICIQSPGSTPSEEATDAG